MKLEQTLLIWIIGFIVGYLSKKTNYNVFINLKENNTNENNT